VFDEEGYESVPDDERRGMQPTAVCATIEELEQELEMVPGSLATTIEQYNRGAANGDDPLFHKRSEFVRPMHAPFGAIDLRSTPLGVFTLGGLHTNPTAEVLDLDGEAIPGLYAAGRTTSGIPSWSYLSGSSLGDGTFFGRRAGTAAAGRKSS
jgi:3-oxo-5alpha-steroid 4-dehydrogenase